MNWNSHVFLHPHTHTHKERMNQYLYSCTYHQGYAYFGAMIFLSDGFEQSGNHWQWSFIVGGDITVKIKVIQGWRERGKRWNGVVMDRGDQTRTKKPTKINEIENEAKQTVMF